MTKKTTKHIQSLKIPKLIISTSKFIAFISLKFVTVLNSKLITTSIKHKIPKRELEMDTNNKYS